MVFVLVIGIKWKLQILPEGIYIRTPWRMWSRFDGKWHSYRITRERIA
jgi:hypothetical protein